MSSGFKMKGSAFYGKKVSYGPAKQGQVNPARPEYRPTAAGEEQMLEDAGAFKQGRSMTPPPGWREERTESAPAAPEAAGLDYINPVENSPAEMKSPNKQNGYGDNQGFKGGMYNIDNMPKPVPGQSGSNQIGTGIPKKKSPNKQGPWGGPSPAKPSRDDMEEYEAWYNSQREQNSPNNQGTQLSKRDEEPAQNIQLKKSPTPRKPKPKDKHDKKKNTPDTI